MFHLNATGYKQEKKGAKVGKEIWVKVSKRFHADLSAKETVMPLMYTWGFWNDNLFCCKAMEG